MVNVFTCVVNQRCNKFGHWPWPASSLCSNRCIWGCFNQL